MIIKVDATIPCRLDRYLKRLYPKFTQGVIERALRQREITVNNYKVEASLRVKEHDEIFINDKLSLPQEENTKTVFSDSVIKLANKIIKNYLIFENEDFLAINKPAGLATQGGTKINISIDDALKYLNQEGSNYKLVHRLDKETSGLLIIAKSYENSVKLTNAFKEKLVFKTYLAVVFGLPPQNSGEIQGLIGKKKEGAYEVVDINNEDGKLAITRYKLLKPLNNNLFLMEFTPVTGRMHQLRFHAKLLGCPIVGDTKYGSDHSSASFKHMLLHATNIVLGEKIFGKEIILEAKLPHYFLNIKQNI